MTNIVLENKQHRRQQLRRRLLCCQQHRGNQKHFNIFYRRILERKGQQNKND